MAEPKRPNDEEIVDNFKLLTELAEKNNGRAGLCRCAACVLLRSLHEARRGWPEPEHSNG